MLLDCCIGNLGDNRRCWIKFVLIYFVIDLVGVPMEPLADSLKSRLASLTAEQIIPVAFAISIPQEVKNKLVDNDLYKQPKLKGKNSHHHRSCNVQ